MTSVDQSAVGPETTTTVASLASELVRCDTTNPTGSELAAAEVVARFLAGGRAEIDVRPFDGDRANLVAKVAGSGGPGLLLCGHLDTVPADGQSWTRSPHSGEVVDGHLHGRGAVDMKGAIAAMAVVMAEFSRSAEPPSGDLVLALTAGEEVDSCGARRLVEEGLLAGIGSIVIGEPTGMRVGVGHKGALWANVETAGLAAHGSRPDEGINSIRLMLDWLSPLSSLEALIAAPRDPLFGSPTLSLNRLDGGVASNVVPARCRALLDFRTLPTQRHEDILTALDARTPQASVTIQRDSRPVVARPDSRLVQVAQRAVSAATGDEAPLIGLSYLTDASVFTEVTDATIILLGPGDDKLAHAADECLPVESLHQAVTCYRRVVTEMLFG